MSAPRICYIGRTETAGGTWHTLERARDLGFDTVLAASGCEAEGGCATLVRACESRGLSLFLDLDVQMVDLRHPLVIRYPDAFAIRRHADPGVTVDPRRPLPGKGFAFVRETDYPEPLIDWWSKQIADWLCAGVRGFRILKPATTPSRLREALIGRALTRGPNRVTFIADTTGQPRKRASALSGFDYCLSSLPWWDGRARWLVEEYDALSRVAPLIAQAESPAKLPPASPSQRRGRLAVAVLTGTGLMLPFSFTEPEMDGEEGADLDAAIRSANEFVRTAQWVDGQLTSLTGAGAPLTVLLRASGRDIRIAEQALIGLINPSSTVAIEPAPELLCGLGEFNKFEPIANFCGYDAKLKPGEVRLFRARRAPAIVVSGRATERDVNAAVNSERVIIANVTPTVDNGAFAAKAIVGQPVTVEADVFTDGHPLLAAELHFKAEGDRHWQHAPMRPVVNDRWQTAMPLDRLGRYVFAIEAWIDEYGTFVRDLNRKREAGFDLSLEIREGQLLLEGAKNSVKGVVDEALSALLRGVEGLEPTDRVGLLLAPETIEMMQRAGSRRFHARSSTYRIDVERREAEFSSWYELFPRSQTNDVSRHGTFRDVVARLPAIRDMGFSVLYFPPIHPVGQTNRKGPNNALNAEPGDVGSVYAIGSSEGGHCAIHSELGTLHDFRTLLAAARDEGLEIALDFAVQASPDHPWLKEHPEWFDWRPDGSIKYAENPPKKYEDIVNVDFYAKERAPDLWLALRDIVLFWSKQGVRIFRVDNPHTKPFPFWQWLIADVRGSHPDVIFLSEAFTRPKIMYHLAKLGFSQSYTYFIWRNAKHELTEYMRELTSRPVADFFRPHFFVNTPDINPYFLQGSGRAGFLIRAALATTLSGLWGMYSGYELCESVPIPGREEYLDSEKYEIKPRNWSAAGNIIAEITQLNRLRMAEPALQSHRGLTFYNAFNDNILYFGKRAPGHTDRILVAISLDPHNVQEADFEIPLWEWGRDDGDALECEDLLRGGHWNWRGKIQHVRLTPEEPYAIWRMRPVREA